MNAPFGKQFLKFSLALCLSFILIYPVFAQTLFTYGKEKVSTEEFLRAFKKNSIPEEENNREALKEYLDLYIAYKLKVKAALDEGLDSLPSQKADLHNFRMQLAESFLTDGQQLDQLIREAAKRSEVDILIGQIFYPFLDPKDTVNAYNLIQRAYKDLQSGAEFSHVVNRYSMDKSSKMNDGVVGYITAFTLPYSIENIVYSLKDGEFSLPYRSSEGYHIFKRISTRKAAGTMQASHILLMFAPDTDESHKERLLKKADSIRTAILKGASFEQLALKYSDDNISYQAGGRIPDVTPGKYDIKFENAVYSLKADNEISVPVITEFGIHIIKRLGHIPVNTDVSDLLVYDHFKRRTLQDDRIQTAKDTLISRILSQTGFTKYYKDNELWQTSDSLFRLINLGDREPFSDTTVVLSIGNKKVTMGNWLGYAKIFTTQDGRLNATYQQLMKDVVSNAAIEYYTEHLENYNPEFGIQLQEFKEGNLLFEIMQRNVWDRAMLDTAGLRKYYLEHKAEYKWLPSASAIVFNCSDSIIYKSFREDLERAPGKWKQLIDETDGRVFADSGRFEINYLPIPYGTQLKENQFTPAVTNDNGSVSFTLILKLYPGDEPREFEDSRGLVQADYQNYLEKIWVQELKKKYPVKVFESELNKLFR
ncbi:MAG TPA: peptidylprolyl isomerase [Parasegetibacter sp.]